MWLLWIILNPANWLLFAAAIALGVGFFYIKRVADFIFDINSWFGVILGAVVFGFMGLAYGGQWAYTQFKVNELETQNTYYKEKLKKDAELVKLANERAQTYGDKVEYLEGILDAARIKLDDTDIADDKETDIACSQCIVARRRSRLLRGGK